MNIADFNRALLVDTEFLMPFAFTLTQDQEDARDLFQETLYRALANKDKYHLGTNLKAWLYTIMRNIFINDYRKKARQQVVFDHSSNDFLINSTKAVTVNTAMATMRIKEVKKNIVNLPIVLKHPFELYLDGYKYNEIADILCEPLGTIKSRIHFARKLLQASIERY